MQTMLEEIFQTSLQVRDTRNRSTAGLYIDQASFIGHRARGTDLIHLRPASVLVPRPLIGHVCYLLMR